MKNLIALAISITAIIVGFSIMAVSGSNIALSKCVKDVEMVSIPPSKIHEIETTVETYLNDDWEMLNLSWTNSKPSGVFILFVRTDCQ